MDIFNNCIKKPEDLITSREQTRAGFIEAALQKNYKALPYVEEAKSLKIFASRAKDPIDLLKMEEIKPKLLTAAGLSDKSLVYFGDSDKDEAIKKLIEEFLKPAGKGFVDELVYRFLLTRGETLGGSMRNWVGHVSEFKFKCKLLSVFSTLNIKYCILFKRDKRKNNWTKSISYENAFNEAEKIDAISWSIGGADKVLFFNSKIPIVKKNVDICLYHGTPETYNSGEIRDCTEKAIMFGELKGGIDPAGADEHWKTAKSALERIREKFGKQGIKTSFLGAAIEKDMASEIFSQLKNGTLTNAANFTNDEHVTNYCEWLIKL